jgi:hypothetical protein
MKFYASTPPGYISASTPPGSYLISAGSWWDPKKGRFILPSFIPENDYFIDSGAWNFRDGEYPFSMEEYIAFAQLWNPQYVALRDFFENAERTFQEIVHFQHYHPAWTWEWVPTLQGKTFEDYKEFLYKLHYEYLSYNLPFPQLITIGAIKPKPIELVRQIISFCQDNRWLHYENYDDYGVPDFNTIELDFHLFGAGLKLLGRLNEAQRSCIFSIDNGSWNGRFGKRIDVFNALMKEHSQTQKQVALNFMLPEYINKVKKIMGGQWNG